MSPPAQGAGLGGSGCEVLLQVQDQEVQEARGHLAECQQELEEARQELEKSKVCCSRRRRDISRNSNHKRRSRRR